MSHLGSPGSVLLDGVQKRKHVSRNWKKTSFFGGRGYCLLPVTSIYLHGNSLGEVFLSLLFIQRNWDSEKEGDLFKVAQIAGGRLFCCLVAKLGLTLLRPHRL